jgi:Uncharacterized small protein (DUF2158)
MSIYDLILEKEPLFTVGDVVRLKSGGPNMTVNRMEGVVTFTGGWIVNYMDTVKTYLKDGSVKESVQLVTQKIHQDVLEKVN